MSDAGPAPISATFLPFLSAGACRQQVLDLAAVVRGDALQAADRDRLAVDAAAPAGRLTRPVAGPAEDAREHVRLAIHHVGVGEPPLRDQPDVLGNVGMGGTRPLAVDDAMVVVRIPDVGWLHAGRDYTVNDGKSLNSGGLSLSRGRGSRSAGRGTEVRRPQSDKIVSRATAWLQTICQQSCRGPTREGGHPHRPRLRRRWQQPGCWSITTGYSANPRLEPCRASERWQRVGVGPHAVRGGGAPRNNQRMLTDLDPDAQTAL